MKPKTSKRTQRVGRKNERGSAILVAVMFMAVLFILTLAASKARVATARDIDHHEASAREYWGARSGAAAIEASLRTDIPTRFKADLELAHMYAGNRNLPAFDPRSVPEGKSQPVIDVEGKRTEYPISTCTSLLGPLDTWAQSRTEIPEAYASKLGFTSRVGVFREAFRQQMSGSMPDTEPAYVLEFSIDATAGENGHVRPSGTLMLGPAVIGCNTAVSLEVSPATIIQGTSASLIITYSNANRIIVTDASGATVADRSVNESSTTESLTIPVTPNGTTTYTAAASSSGGCSALSAPRTITVTLPPPQITFSANPPCIVRGQTSTLSWTISGATSATINGQPVNPSSGTMSVSPTQTTTYTLIASNEGGSSQAQATVNVSIPPIINLFTATPNCITPGGSSVIRWNVANATSVTINGAAVDPQSGSMTVTPAANTTYTIVATGAGCLAQTAQAQTTIAVATVPQITLFTATPGTINRGESSVLQWRITGASSATINGQPINPAKGTITVSPAETTAYTLVATSGGCSPQTTQSQVTVTVTTGPDPGSCPAITSFTANPSCVPQGQTSTLSWAVTNADSVTINGQSVIPQAGSISVTPAGTTTYTLVASRAGCPSQQAQVTVGMGVAPVINSFTASPGSIQQNQSSNLSWSVAGAASVTIDGQSVNPQAGSMSVSPAGTHTYTLVATSGGCSPQTTQSQVTVTVTNCPSISFFTATPGSIFTGGNSTLQWSVTDASAVTLNGAPVPSSGSIIVSPQSTTTYRLLAQSASGLCDVERFVTVTVNTCSAPIINSFTATPNSVSPGGNQLVRLAWSVTDTTQTGLTITITPSVGTFNTATGFVEISQPQTTTTFTLTAVNGCGASAYANVTVTVNPVNCNSYTDPLPANQVPPVSGPKILYFRASKDYVRPNEPGDPNASFPWGDARRVDFAWDTLDADNVTINGIPVTSRGYGLQPYASNPLPSFTQFPTANTTYIIEAWQSSNPTYHARAEIPIGWKPAPPLAIVIYVGDTNNHQPGDAVQVSFSAGVWHYNQIDRSGVTVEVEGVTTNLSPIGTITLAASNTTREYKFIAHRGNETAIDYYTLMVEPPNSLGVGWYAKGWRADLGWTLNPLGAGVRMHRLSNGAIRIAPEYYGFLFSVPGGGYGGEEGTPLIELYKDGEAIVEKYHLDRYVVGSWGVNGPVGSVNIIPASLIPNAACGRIDLTLTAGYSDLGNTTTGGSYAPNRFLVDTRNGYAAPPSCPNSGPCLPTGFVLRNPWTQAMWDNFSLEPTTP